MAWGAAKWRVAVPRLRNRALRGAETGSRDPKPQPESGDAMNPSAASIHHPATVLQPLGSFDLPPIPYD